MLIATEVLQRHLSEPDWIVFDCRHDLMDHARGARLYAESHIPGAFFAPVETALSGAKTGTNGRHPLPAPADFAAFLNRHGVTATTRIVAYDDVGGQYAARLWWLARWIGHPNAAVLDGGLPKWLAEGRPVTSAPPAVRPAGSVSAQADMDRVRTVAEVQAMAGRGLMVDARSPERYRGEVEPIDRVAGRIPGAVNRFFKLNLNADLTLRPAEELRAEFVRLLAGRDPAEVVHQCGSGITACANLLAMEHAGLAGSRLYAGSWSEWIADPARPIERG
ncbi:MAG: sulfurtransferase [Opitutaceae bacterium]|nr:sulfurtransferase [Opitutaceae bacterium]